MKDSSLAQLVEHYKVFTIRQGSKVRQIEAPDEELKAYQRTLIPFFNEYDAFYPGCTARIGNSVLDNAKPHHNSNILFKTDIKSFYPSITLTHLLRNIDLHSNSVWQANAREVLPACLIPNGGQLTLPTGAPTSPILSCIAATDLDLTLANIANIYGYLYTRYIDDLTFSSKGEKVTALEKEVGQAIIDYGFQSNRKKTNWIHPHRDKTFTVTGVALDTDNSKSRVPKEIRRICRARLDKIALNNIPLDKVTQGYMAYIKMLDTSSFEKMQDYLEKRKARYVSISS